MSTASIPTREQHHRLDQCLSETRLAYNAMLEYAKTQYQRDQTFPNKYDLDKAFAGTSGTHTPATTQQTLRIVSQKRSSSSSTIAPTDNPMAVPVSASLASNQPISGTRFNCASTAPKAMFGLMDGIWLFRRSSACASRSSCHRPLEGTPKTVYLVKRADGHWFAMIVCDDGRSSAASRPDARPATCDWARCWLDVVPDRQ